MNFFGQVSIAGIFWEKSPPPALRLFLTVRPLIRKGENALMSRIEHNNYLISTFILFNKYISVLFHIWQKDLCFGELLHQWGHS